MAKAVAAAAAQATKSSVLEEEIQELRMTLREKEKSFLEAQRTRHTHSLIGMNTNKYNRHLSNQEITRYSRQIFLMKHYKLQVMLKRKVVILVGCGSVGCACAMYLVGAGVGCLVIVDDGLIKSTSLHRQIIHNEEDVGKPIVTCIYETLRGYVSSFHKLSFL